MVLFQEWTWSFSLCCSYWEKKKNVNDVLWVELTVAETLVSFKDK